MKFQFAVSVLSHHLGRRWAPTFAAAFFYLSLSPCVFADSVRIGSRVLIDGDTQAKVLSVAGPPQSKHAVKSAAKGKSKTKDKASEKESGKAECWVYTIDGKTVEITLRNGVVAKIATSKQRSDQAGAASSSKPRKTRKKSAP